MHQHLPVIGICGFSGSGKTTLIEHLVQHYVNQGLRVAVIKHDVHGLVIDKEGKDSDRFFKAGADVMMRGPDQLFSRSHQTERQLIDLVAQTIHMYDLIFLEGHKNTPFFDKIWLEKDPDDCPNTTAGVQMCLSRSEDRFGKMLDFLDSWTVRTLEKTPVFGGLLSLAETHRGITPKTLITLLDQLRPYVDNLLVIGPKYEETLSSLPHLVPVPSLQPEAGAILAARRWAPHSDWLFFTVDDLCDTLPHIIDLAGQDASLLAPRHSRMTLPLRLDYRTALRHPEE